MLRTAVVYVKPDWFRCTNSSLGCRINSTAIMYILTTLLSASLGIQAVFASPIPTRTLYKVKETHSVPRRWIQRGRAPRSHMIHMQIGLKQSQFDELERHLYEGVTAILSIRSDWRFQIREEIDADQGC